MKKVFVLLTIFTFLLLNVSFLTPVQAADAYFKLQPIQGAYYLGQDFNVNILINTGNEPTDAADVILYYDPYYLEVLDANFAVPGIQVNTGSIYQMYPGNEVDAAIGRIRLTGFSMMSPYNSNGGEGIFATITFRGLHLTDGTAVAFEFNPGDSHDCNLAQNITSADILTMTIGGNYQIIPDTTAPYIINFNPANGASGVSPNADVSFHLKDDQTAVDINSVVIIIDNVEYTLVGPNKFTYSGNEKDYYIYVNLPTFDYEQNININVKAADIYGNLLSQDFSFTTGPQPVNEPPYLKNLTDKTVFAGSQLNFVVEADDPNAGDALIINMQNAPAAATLTKISNGKYLFSWQTDQSDLGEYYIDFSVSDNGQPQMTDFQTVKISVVQAIVQPPTEPQEFECPPCPPCGERTQCSDNRDNDSDGLIDYSADPQCSDYYDNDESTLGKQVAGIFNKLKVAFLNNSVVKSIKKNFLKIASPDGNGQLILQPSTGNFYPGQEFRVKILVDTDNAPTDAVDAVLNYNPNYLEVLDALPEPGIQIQPGTLYESYPGNVVDPVVGEIKMTAFSIMSSYNSGDHTGVLATIDFRAKQVVSNTPVDFDFTLGETTDSNIALDITSEDILTAVTNGSYNIIPDANPPYITNFTPPDSSVNRSVNQDISFRINDDETAVDINSVIVRVEDQEYQASVAPIFGYLGNEKSYQISINLPPFVYEQVVDIYIDAQDSQGNTMSTYYSWFQIMSEPINNLPVLENIPDQTAQAGTHLSFIVNAFDADTADILTYSLSNAPAGATIVKLDNNRALFEWTPPIDAQGNYFVTVKVQDNGEPRLSDEQIVTIQILETQVVPAAPAELICPQCPVCPQCLDNFDNDGDGLVDYPFDPGCESVDDDDETDLFITQCSDGLDNDQDGLIDYPSDPGCESAADDDETDIFITQCSDGLDNDQDGLIDYPSDPGCDSAADDDETDIIIPLPACSDGIDNDNDGLIDYPADPDCISLQDDSEFEEIEAEKIIKQFIDSFDESVKGFQDKLEELLGPVVAGILNKTIDNPEVEKITEDYVIPALFILTVLAFGALLAYFIIGRRKVRGVVYDSVTKKPITLAVVKIYWQETDLIKSLCVSQTKGQFGLKVKPGQYYIKVFKFNYNFPSYLLKGKTQDGDYKNLYFGETLIITPETKKIVVSIPLDSDLAQVKIDEKEEKAKRLRKFLRFFMRLALVLALLTLIVLPKIISGAILAVLLMIYRFLLRFIRLVKKVTKRRI